jgi:hypothetical protein
MKKFKLTVQEFMYLSCSRFLSDEWKHLMDQSIDKKGQDYFLMISEEKADELRDLCGDELQVTGFDEQYKLTKEGEILESLIDKLYCN